MFATNFARNAIGAFGAVAIAATCLGVAAVPAAAATETGVATKTVSYADLNMNSAEGRARLDARIRAAAKSVCEAPVAEFAARATQGRCIATAIRKANAS